MGLFDRKKEGGLMDVIRCDEKEYLVWKWVLQEMQILPRKKIPFDMVVLCV